MQEKRTFGSYFTKKVITGLSVIATLSAIVGGIWAFESHYATHDDVESLEVKVIGSMQNYQLKTDYKFYQFLYDKLQLDIFLMRKQLEVNTDDVDLRTDYNELIKQKNDIKNKMEKTLKEIK